MAVERCVAIEGDLVPARLGIKDQIYEQLKTELNIIISNAASVSYSDPIKDAIATNFHGAMKLMQLAKESKNFTVFVHVSTVGVNMHNKPGTINNEQVYWEPGDEKIIETVAKIDAMNPQE